MVGWEDGKNGGKISGYNNYQGRHDHDARHGPCISDFFGTFPDLAIFFSLLSARYETL